MAVQRTHEYRVAYCLTSNLFKPVLVYLNSHPLFDVKMEVVNFEFEHFATFYFGPSKEFDFSTNFYSHDTGKTYDAKTKKYTKEKRVNYGDA